MPIVHFPTVPASAADSPKASATLFLRGTTMSTAIITQRPDQWISADTDEQFIALFLRQKRSHHTRRAYAQTLAQFLQFTGGKPLAAMMLEDLLGYADWLDNNAYAKASQALKLSTVKSLLAFG